MSEEISGENVCSLPDMVFAFAPSRRILLAVGDSSKAAIDRYGADADDWPIHPIPTEDDLNRVVIVVWDKSSRWWGNKWHAMTDFQAKVLRWPSEKVKPCIEFETRTWAVVR